MGLGVGCRNGRKYYTYRYVRVCVPFRRSRYRHCCTYPSLRREGRGRGRRNPKSFQTQNPKPKTQAMGVTAPRRAHEVVSQARMISSYMHMCCASGDPGADMLHAPPPPPPPPRARARARGRQSPKSKKNPRFEMWPCAAALPNREAVEI